MNENDRYIRVQQPIMKLGQLFNKCKVFDQQMFGRPMKNVFSNNKY